MNCLSINKTITIMEPHNLSTAESGMLLGLLKEKIKLIKTEADPNTLKKLGTGRLQQLYNKIKTTAKL